MQRRYLAPLGALAVVLTLISLIAISVAGQAPSPTAVRPTSKPALPKPGPAPRTAWGDPDLQGTWFVMESVPFERSQANAGKALLTDAEVAALDKQKSADPGRNARSDNSTQDVTGAYNAVFNSVLRTSKRTSMITIRPMGEFLL